jgi:hypothetical protein
MEELEEQPQLPEAEQMEGSERVREQMRLHIDLAASGEKANPGCARPTHLQASLKVLSIGAVDHLSVELKPVGAIPDNLTVDLVAQLSRQSQKWRGKRIALGAWAD